jgi:hypothetical protein
MDQKMTDKGILVPGQQKGVALGSLRLPVLAVCEERAILTGVRIRSWFQWNGTSTEAAKILVSWYSMHEALRACKLEEKLFRGVSPAFGVKTSADGSLKG